MPKVLDPGKGKLVVQYRMWKTPGEALVSHPFRIVHAGQSKTFQHLQEARDFAVRNGYIGIKVQSNRSDQ